MTLKRVLRLWSDIVYGLNFAVHLALKVHQTPKGAEVPPASALSRIGVVTSAHADSAAPSSQSCDVQDHSVAFLNLPKDSNVVPFWVVYYNP